MSEQRWVDSLLAPHVQPAEFIERLDALNHITKEIRNG